MAEAARKPKESGSSPRSTGEKPEDRVSLENLTPAQIVAELDKYIIGQRDAKRAVAVALRNRYRRQQLDEDLRQEVQPKNILMIGPTGVGKTEIARRVAKIVEAPFIKVESTKFTEVGYVGRDVESIIRDLVEISISMLHGQRLEQVKDEATKVAVQRLAEILAEQVIEKRSTRNGRKSSNGESKQDSLEEQLRQEHAAKRRLERERKRLLHLLDQQALEEETVEIEIEGEGEFDEYGPL